MEYKEIYLRLALCVFFGVGTVLGKEFECKPQLGSKLSELLGDQEKLPISCQMEHDIDEVVQQQTQQSNTLTLLGLMMDAMATEIIELRNKSERLEKELAEMRNPPDADNFCNEHDGIMYDGTCLWEEERPEKMALVDAYRKCNSVTPSKLPEFYNEEQYNQLMEFLRGKIPSNENYIRIWSGLTRDHWTGEAFLSNGEPAPYVKISALRDIGRKALPYETNAYIEARKSRSSVNEGIRVETATTNFQFKVVTVLCQTLPLLSKSKYKTKEDEVWCENVGGIAYNGSCLWAEEAPTYMPMSRALEICNERASSKLPEIYGGKEYIEIMEYTRTKSKSDSTFAWTAMTRNLTTNQAMLSDGTPAPYTKPRTDSSRWETATDDRTNVYLLARVTRDTAFHDQGLGSIRPTYDFETEDKIVLCQKL